MTRYEYALQDLLGLPLRFAEDLPSDPISKDGLQSSAELLHLTPMQLEAYLESNRRARAVEPRGQWNREGSGPRARTAQRLWPLPHAAKWVLAPDGLRPALCLSADDAQGSAVTPATCADTCSSRGDRISAVGTYSNS